MTKAERLARLAAAAVAVALVVAASAACSGTIESVADGGHAADAAADGGSAEGGAPDANGTDGAPPDGAPPDGALPDGALPQLDGPVDGQCGAANGRSTNSAPFTELCSVGTPSSVAGSGPWTWTCAGANGGNAASCSAPFQPSSVSCTSLSLPPEAQPVDTSSPTTVVGTGTPASCTFAALAAAVSQGGIITFDCGSAPVTIPVTASLTPPATTSGAARHTVIDGGNLVTLDGGGAVRIINWYHPSWQTNDDTLTLQHLALVNGKATPTEAIPPCTQTPNDQCSTGFYDGQGGALFMRDGLLRVIGCTFSNNQAALLGPDTGGGAIYVMGSRLVYIASSTFTGNQASNAGAVGMLWAGAYIFNSLFDDNSAMGDGANSSDPAHCACVHEGQNQIGSGGNGGAVYKDGGDNQDVTICGTEIRANSANEFGAAVFLTCNGSTAKLILLDSLLTDNTSPVPYWNWCPGVSTDNPYSSGCSTCAPNPVNTSFCTGGTCTTTCSG
jgi:hypothetical protein